MSLMSPRPALPVEVDAYKDWHLDRLQVPPGITGLWQVKGRSDLPFDDHVRLDLFYIENWSVGYDMYILAKTLPAVFAGRGAFERGPRPALPPPPARGGAFSVAFS